MIRENLRMMAATVLMANLALMMPGGALASPRPGGPDAGSPTTTPIKHLVVIFLENRSFDHYFGTYPVAANPPGETPFFAKPNTPQVNGLTPGIISQNSSHDASDNLYPPFRFDPSQNYTCDQNHDYTPEQEAFDSGLLDEYPEFTAQPCTAPAYPASLVDLGPGIVMGHYDGNTVTGLWNYAQNFAMSDNMFDTNFGPSTPGAINVISGMTGNVDPSLQVGVAGVVVDNSDTGDADPYFDDCSSPSSHFGMSSANLNIGNLLTNAGITWGWFQGGFTPSSTTSGGTAVCATQTAELNGTLQTAYSPHHNPFQYYLSTSNMHHTPPANLTEIGHAGPANHEYDLSYFEPAALAGNLPAVSYLKPNRAQDDHPGNSSPLDAQVFIVNTINFLESLPTWPETAVIITYDDSDGWYDHVAGPVVNQSVSSADATASVGSGLCGLGKNSLAGLQARCGYGPRLPFLVISPWSRSNFVAHTLLDQSSVVRFIEDNWGLARIGNGSFDVIAGSIMNMFDFTVPQSPPLFLNPANGQIVFGGGH